jgi:hypothetical protein
MSKVSNKLNAALTLFAVALILYITALLIDSPDLELFSRPIIIPSIYYYYYIKVRGSINLLFSISILSYFTGEIINLISEKDLVKAELLFFIIPYFITTYFLYQDFTYYLKKRKYNMESISFFIVLSLLIYIIYSVLAMTTDTDDFEFGIYIVFAILLFVMTTLSFLIQVNYSNKTIFFMILMVSSFLFSDIFYVFSVMMNEVFSLKMINVITQQLSYFLFVSYFINRTNYKLWKKRSQIII